MQSVLSVTSRDGKSLAAHQLVSYQNLKTFSVKSVTVHLDHTQHQAAMPRYLRIDMTSHSAKLAIMNIIHLAFRTQSTGRALLELVTAVRKSSWSSYLYGYEWS